MDPIELYRRYQELQAYVGWNDADADRVRAIATLLDDRLNALIDDFYAEMVRHPRAVRVITGGQRQIDRLKESLRRWVRELLQGPYDRDYVMRRWQVGKRHVEIGLEQYYTNVALSRLRFGLARALNACWKGEPEMLIAAIEALNKLLDLDLAIIEDAYQTEYMNRLQRSERLATIGQIAGGVAHELRNPLNVINTSAYFLLHARNPSPEKTIEHLRRIEQHIGMANGVITALANFARMPLPDMRPFALERCFGEALQANPLPDAVSVELDFAPSLPQALGDAEQLRLVFANLIRNAGDAMPQGGRLVVQGARTPGGVEVSVADTGIGMSPEDLHRIAEPLYSTKARGLGLGLALSRAILDKNQGSLHAASEPGRGSTFTVRLKSEPDGEFHKT
jgi:signal transduction histidine kinase